MQDLVVKKPQQRKKTCIMRKSRLTTKHEYLPSVKIIMKTLKTC